MATNDAASIRWEEIACPICDQTSRKLVRKTRNLLYQTAEEFQLVRCVACGHVYLNPRPTGESIGRFYPADYSPHVGEGAGGPARPPGDSSATPWHLSGPVRAVPGLRSLYYWLKETRSQIIPPVDKPRPQALELGCAGGRFLEMLRERGWQAEGLEPAEGPVAEARRRGFRVHHGPIAPGIFPPRSQDAVFAWMVLEHLHDPRMALAEIRSILRPGGWLVFSVPNWACAERWLMGRYWYPLEPPIHLHHFTPRTLRRILVEAGFERIEVIHQRNVFNVMGSLGLWLREKFPRGRLGPKLLDFVNHPSVRGQLSLAPLAKGLAWMHQGGRLTVTARKPSQ
ncbi:MAG: class I SAM-dependent methyltransferase [Thermoguttaceae bacterium]